MANAKSAKRERPLAVSTSVEQRDSFYFGDEGDPDYELLFSPFVPEDLQRIARCASDVIIAAARLLEQAASDDNSSKSAKSLWAKYLTLKKVQALLVVPAKPLIAEMVAARKRLGKPLPSFKGLTGMCGIEIVAKLGESVLDVCAECVPREVKPDLYSMREKPDLYSMRESLRALPRLFLDDHLDLLSGYSWEIDCAARLRFDPNANVTGPHASDLEVLGQNEIAVLKFLAAQHPVTMTQFDIADKAKPSLSEKTVGNCLKRLREIGYVDSPLGKRRGTTVTRTGLEAARQITV